jgi:hypothetical protein
MGIQLPKPLQPLILNQYSTVMFHRYVKFGKDSKEWKETTQLLSILCNTLKAIESLEDWQYLHDVNEATTTKVSDLLNASNLNKEKVAIAIHNLKNHYERSLRESHFFTKEANEADTAISSLEDLEYPQAPLLDEATEQTIQQKNHPSCQLPDEVQPNAWFEVYIGPGKPIRRLKLSIILNEKSQLIFVDHRGNKIVEKDATEFKKELSEELSRLIVDRLIFEHALGQVISSIAKNK